MKSADLHRRIAAALSRIHVVTRAAGRKAADAAQVSPLQMDILQALARESGQRPGALAKALELTPGTISVAVSALEKKSLVAKQSDPEEHRAVRLVLTAKGRRIAAGHEDWADASLQPLVNDLEEAEAGDVLAALLTLLRSAEERGLIQANAMCLQCQYFQPWGGNATDRRHRCDLLKKAISASDLQVDCPDFVLATPEERAARAGITASEDPS